MKNIVITLFFLVSVFGFSQGGPKVDVIKFRGEVTTTIRDGFNVPNNETWLIYNVTTEQLEFANSDDVWEPIGSTLTDAEISAAFLTVNPNTDLDSTDDFDGAFTSLSGIPAGLSDGDDIGTDDQAISIAGNTLTLEDGGTVDLSGYLDDTTLSDAQVSTAFLTVNPNTDLDSSNDVTIAGTQTITGVKTFTSSSTLIDGYLQMKKITGSNKLAEYSNLSFNANDNLRVVGNALNNRYVFNANLITNERTYTFPDASGTIALTSDLPTALSNAEISTAFLTVNPNTDLEVGNDVEAGSASPFQGIKVWAGTKVQFRTDEPHLDPEYATGVIIVTDSVPPLPEALDNVFVDGAGNATYKNSVIVPEGVTNISDNGFNTVGLSNVSLPSTLLTIGDYAFNNNILTSSTIPSGVTSIGDFAFSNNNITSLTIPNSVTSLGQYAFSNNNIASVTIPSSVTSIGGYAFRNNSITTLTIPSGVTSIEIQAFVNNNLTSVTIPISVTFIGDNAFLNNNLTSVSLPTGITLGTNVFDAGVTITYY